MEDQFPGVFVGLQICPHLLVGAVVVLAELRQDQHLEGGLDEVAGKEAFQLRRRAEFEVGAGLLPKNQGKQEELAAASLYAWTAALLGSKRLLEGDPGDTQRRHLDLQAQALPGIKGQKNRRAVVHGGLGLT